MHQGAKLALHELQVVPDQGRIGGDGRLAGLLDQGGMASNTRKTYDKSYRAYRDWVDFSGEGEAREAHTVALYLKHLLDSEYKSASIRVHVAAIRHGLVESGWADPFLGAEAAELSRVFKGVMTECARRGNEVPQRAKILTALEVRKMADACPKTKQGYRDRALLFCLLALGCRRSEIADIMLSDLKFCEGGMTVASRRSASSSKTAPHLRLIPKTDGEYCPVKALNDWLDVAGIRIGSEFDRPVFCGIRAGGSLRKSGLSGTSVVDIMKRLAKSAGVDPEMVSGHSSRRTMIVLAAESGVDDAEIMATTGHKSAATLAIYTDGALRGSAAKGAFQRIEEAC